MRATAVGIGFRYFNDWALFEIESLTYDIMMDGTNNNDKCSNQ